ncbi:cystathionine beta-lyase, partial [Coemansia sp. RSA 2320]
LTGAGGGGCALTLIPHGTPDDSVDAVERELAVEGFQCYRTVVGGGGVAITREVRGCSIEMWLRSLLDQQQQNTSQSCSDVFDIEIAGFAAFSAGSIAELKPK